MTDRCVPFVQIGAIDKGHFDAIARQDLFQDIKARPKQRARRHDVIARSQHRGQRPIDGGHSAGRSKSVLCPFHRRDTLFKHGDRWVAVTGVDEFIVTRFQKPCFGIFSSVIDKALRHEDRFAYLIVLAAANTAVDGLGAFVPVAHLTSLAMRHQKTPTPGKVSGLRPYPFSGIFNVARNPVTNRHMTWIRRSAAGVKRLRCPCPRAR